jgi:hypothetical protein
MDATNDANHSGGKEQQRQPDKKDPVGITSPSTPIPIMATGTLPIKPDPPAQISKTPASVGIHVLCDRFCSISTNPSMVQSQVCAGDMALTQHFGVHPVLVQSGR